MLRSHDDPANKMTFSYRDLEVTSIFDLVAWRKGDLYDDAHVFAKLEFKAHHYNHSQFVAQLLTQGFQKFDKKLIDEDGRIRYVISWAHPIVV